MDEFDPRRATTELVAAFINHNTLSASELPQLLTSVFRAITGFEADRADPLVASDEVISQAGSETPLSEPETAAIDIVPVEAATEPANIVPAVSIEASIADPGYIISLITGEKLKTLKRHLKTHGLTVEDYKARYNLPHDYPLVAPAYSAKRREVARTMGLGRKPAVKTAEKAAVAEALPATQPAAESKPSASAKAEQTKKRASAPQKAGVKAAKGGAVSKAKSAGKRAAQPVTAETKVTASVASPASKEASPAPVPARVKKQAAVPKKAAAKPVSEAVLSNADEAIVLDPPAASPGQKPADTPKASETPAAEAVREVEVPAPMSTESETDSKAPGKWRRKLTAAFK